MTQVSRKRRRQAEGSDSDTVNLLGHPSSMRPAAKKRKAANQPHRRDTATTGEIHVAPSHKRSRITLRLRPRYHDLGPAEKAWWTASELLEQQRVEQKQDEAAAKEKLRQDWMRRLRPTPARMARSAATAKGRV
ncbi:hypothetical protein N7492_008490 [Penicillium capsulatum]|uniref:Uncharacterized protein n=1 Tax=Penicillium capsulatum TaxID=69766 RepID=A0A9W9HRN9_9EURO|nr:hypothetical protein N7492_008475 [Penicillium capsulatum]KAJ5155687.1 hypothetical protein N7492_008490 [Penicillium capsulatum]KAJ6105876.1 hypothetical protein N7512_009393 [Penicillium capsulatum]KAJ6105892.1 hypothetical protein N7512_009409 [Penicillium capsulatum]